MGLPISLRWPYFDVALGTILFGTIQRSTDPLAFFCGQSVTIASVVLVGVIETIE